MNPDDEKPPENKPAPPTQEELRRSNRSERLSRGWAHKCACGRPFTTKGAYKRHVENYHGAKTDEGNDEIPPNAPNDSEKPA